LSLFLYTHTPTSPLSPLSLHDALPISRFGTALYALARRRRTSRHVAYDRGLSALRTVFRRITPASEQLQPQRHQLEPEPRCDRLDRKSTRLNSSHVKISYAVFCLKKKK